VLLRRPFVAEIHEGLRQVGAQLRAARSFGAFDHDLGDLESHRPQLDRLTIAVRPAAEVCLRQPIESVRFEDIDQQSHLDSVSTHERQFSQQCNARRVLTR
jgi:hypothetical protein